MRAMLLMALAGLLVPALSTATDPPPSSIGFADPSDIETLLEYRLPTWGYRNWDVGFDLLGSGLESNDDTSRFDVNGRTRLDLFRESEDYVRSVRVEFQGGFQRRNFDAENDDADNHIRSSRGQVTVSGREQRYLGSDLFGTVAILGLAWSGRRTRICRASATTWALVTIRPPSMRKPLPSAPWTAFMRMAIGSPIAPLSSSSLALTRGG